MVKYIDRILILSLLFVRPCYCQTTYTSLVGGSWNNITNVWSTNGSTPCACSPAYTIGTADIVIDHPIVLSNDVSINSGGNVLIDISGSITGTNKEIVVHAGGNIETYGPVNVMSVEIEAGGNGDFHHTIQCVDKFRVEGTATADSFIYITDGDVEIKETGVLDLYVPVLEVDVPFHEFKSDGILNFHGTCLYILRGDFRNKITASLNGTGYVEVQDGEIRNEGIWSSDVNWCSSLPASGMLFPQNCSGCIVILPIDLISFSAIPDDKLISLEWITATEINTDYYVIERSLNSISWQKIGSVAGIVNSVTETHYFFADKMLPADRILYYRVGNVDLSGVIDYSPVIAVKNPMYSEAVFGFYNSYGRYFRILDDAPPGIYIELQYIGNRIIFHNPD